MTHSAENDAGLTEPERELLSSLCDVDAPRGAGHDGYCYAHHAPVKWAGRANADEVCCIQVEDFVEQVLALRTRPIPPEVDPTPWRHTGPLLPGERVIPPEVT